MPTLQNIRETFTRALAITYKPVPIWNGKGNDPLNETDLKTAVNARRVFAGAILVSTALAGYAVFSASLLVGVAAASLLIISAIAVRQLSLYRTRYFAGIADQVKTVVGGLEKDKAGFESAVTLRKALMGLTGPADLKEAISSVNQYLLDCSRQLDVNNDAIIAITVLKTLKDLGEFSKTDDVKKIIKRIENNFNKLALNLKSIQELLQFLENYGTSLTTLSLANIDTKVKKIEPEDFERALSLCPNLQMLDTSDYPIDDPMMKSISIKHPDLVALKCYHLRKLTDAGFSHLVKLKGLQKLEINDLNCTDIGVRKVISELNNLSELKLQNFNQLTDDTMKEWEKLPLIRLDLWWVEKISGKHLGAFSKLVTLDLTSFKEPTDVLCQELQNLKSLKELMLYSVDNLTVDQVKTLIPQLTSLEKILIQHCPLITDLHCQELKAQFPAINIVA